MQREIAMGDQVGRCRLNFGSKLALPLHPSLLLLPLALAVAVLHPSTLLGKPSSSR
jgi:hypothetical protein